MKPDRHSSCEERERLFGFIALGLEEEDCPQFARALDAYVARVLRTEADYLRTLPQPQQATALQGYYWFGQGFVDAAHEVYRSADCFEPEPQRQESG